MDNFDSLLNYDALLEAEKITGQSYKDDRGTMGLGFLLLQESAQRKKDELMLREDTYWSMPYTQGIDVAQDLGFVPVWAHAGNSMYGNPQHTVCMWHEGILLTMNSYNGNLNSANISFNWRPFEGGFGDFAPIFRFGISGGMEHHSEGFDDVDGDPWVMVASIDVREGMKHQIEKLRASGKLLTEWYVTDDLLRVRVGDEEKSDFSDENWHDKIKNTIRQRVAEFDEPARSAIQAGMRGKDWN